MENCTLSRDLVIDILARLPVKSLMRFKCVCKFFNDLISSDLHFMHKHYGISKAKRDCVLLEDGWEVREFYLLYKESHSNEEIGCIFLDIPRMRRTPCVKCCQGMLCVISCRNDLGNLKGDDDLIYDVLIWNPSFRKIKALPSVTLPYKLPNYPVVKDTFGFGISNNMTWKVVMALEIEIIDGEERGNVHQIAMVCSQVTSDLWDWRQVNSVPPLGEFVDDNDFYLKGMYYLLTLIYLEYNQTVTVKRQLRWFDMDDEVFGTMELPSNFTINSVTIMNETIALLGYPGLGNLIDLSCIEIWLMTQNSNWHKQARVDCVLNLDNNEYWKPIGIWNLDTHLLVFLNTTLSQDGWDDDLKCEVPYFISIDLATRERKMFTISQECKSINIASTAAGYFQVYNEKSTDITEEWSHKLFDQNSIYARVYSESLCFS